MRFLREKKTLQQFWPKVQHICALFEPLSGDETVFQIFSAFSQNTVEPFCITTAKILSNLALWPHRYADKIIAVLQNVTKSKRSNHQVTKALHMWQLITPQSYHAFAFTIESETFQHSLTNSW